MEFQPRHCSGLWKLNLYSDRAFIFRNETVEISYKRGWGRGAGDSRCHGTQVSKDQLQWMNQHLTFDYSKTKGFLQRNQKGRQSAVSTQDGRSSVVKSRRTKTTSSTATKLLDGDTESASEDMVLPCRENGACWYGEPWPQTVSITELHTPKVKIRRTQSVTKIADQWREKWSMGQRWEETTPEKIMTEMGDIQPHVRLQAVNTVRDLPNESTSTTIQRVYFNVIHMVLYTFLFFFLFL